MIFPMSLVRISLVLNCGHFKQSCLSFTFQYSTFIVSSYYYYYVVLYFRCLNWIISLKAICSEVDVLSVILYLQRAYGGVLLD